GDSLFGSYGVDAAVLAVLGGPDAFELLLRRNLVTGATVALRRELADAAFPFPSAWVHDEWIAIVAAAHGRIVPLPQRLIDYRQHGSNVIGAVSLTMRGKFSRLVEPGFERNRRLLERATQLADWYATLPSAIPARRSAVDNKVHHERVRSSLSRHRLARIRAVLAEARTGRYREFGGGLQDIARDLVQPLRD
ncbi:MAG: glycosyltransferase family 2 protein, partial [Rhodoglobus sp.]